MSKKKTKRRTMPTQIVLGVNKIKLRPGTLDMEDDRFAHWDAVKGEIVVHTHTKGAEMGNSVIHELVHASLHYRGADLPVKMEERVATILGADIQEFILRNPKVIEWIQKGCP